MKHFKYKEGLPKWWDAIKRGGFRSLLILLVENSKSSARGEYERKSKC